MHPSSDMYLGLMRLKNRGFNPAAILDIGAYEGHWTRAVRQIFPDAFVLMVDALQEKEPLLKEVAAAVGHADYVMTLLADAEAADAKFFVANAQAPGILIQTGSSRYRENTTVPIEVRTVAQRTLDSVLSQYPQRFELIKLDVQGAELDVLRGAKDHLKNFQAILLEISALPYNNGAPLAADIFHQMKEWGFVLYDILDQARFTEQRYLVQFDALFAREEAAFRPRPPFF